MDNTDDVLTGATFRPDSETYYQSLAGVMLLAMLSAGLIPICVVTAFRWWELVVLLLVLINAGGIVSLLRQARAWAIAAPEAFIYHGLRQTTTIPWSDVKRIIVDCSGTVLIIRDAGQTMVHTSQLQNGTKLLQEIRRLTTGAQVLRLKTSLLVWYQLQRIRLMLGCAAGLTCLLGFASDWTIVALGIVTGFGSCMIWAGPYLQRRVIEIVGYISIWAGVGGAVDIAFIPGMLRADMAVTHATAFLGASIFGWFLSALCLRNTLLSPNSDDFAPTLIPPSRSIPAGR